MKKEKSKFSELYQPLSDYIIMPYVDNEKTPSGIIIPSVETVALRTKGDRESMEQAIEREKAKRMATEQFFFEVTGVGPDVRTVKEGDHVLLAPNVRAAVFEIAGGKYIQCREMELFAIVSKELVEIDRLHKSPQSSEPDTIAEMKVVN